MKNAAILLIIMGILAGCRKEEAVVIEQPKPPTQTYAVQSLDVKTFIEATGTIQADPEGSVKVISPLAGAIEKINVRVGDPVKKGDVLATIKSADLSDTYSSYLATLAQFKQSERTYKMNLELFEIGAVTKNDLLISESAFKQFDANLAGLKRKLELYGVTSPGDFTNKLQIKSPMDGRVVDIHVHVGDRMDTAATLLTIADPNKIMVVANIYDTDILKIHKDNEVTFATDIFPGKTFSGVVAYLSDVEDIESKTVKTYIKLREGSALFKLNMFLDIKILYDERAVPVIPKTAMIYQDGRFFVYVKNENGYDKRQIRPLRDVDDKSISVEGLAEGEEIVLSAINQEKI